MKELFKQRIIISAKFNHTVTRPFIKFEEFHSYNRDKTTFDRLFKTFIHFVKTRKEVRASGRKRSKRPSAIVACFTAIEMYHRLNISQQNQSKRCNNSLTFSTKLL